MSEVESKYWTAFYTKPRNEKKVAERLSTSGFEVYCPLRVTLKQWSDRKKKVKEPVFTSYLFAKVDELERGAILQDQGVVSSVFWLKKPVRIRQSEIDAIRTFLDEYPEAQGAPIDIREGDQAQIAAGPFQGESGIVQQIRGNKVLLQLQTLGLALQAEVSMHKLSSVSSLRTELNN